MEKAKVNSGLDFEVYSVFLEYTLDSIVESAKTDPKAKALVLEAIQKARKSFEDDLNEVHESEETEQAVFEELDCIEDNLAN